MTTNEVARLFGKEKSGDSSEAAPAEVLKQLQESALELLGGLDRAPRSLRIKADQVEIELEWATPEPAAGAAAGAIPGAIPSAVPGAAVALPEAAHNRESPTGQYVVAHTVGVFYRAPEPGAKPFVEVGDVIAPGQQMGIIEAMKLMIPVESEVAGRVVEVLATDGAAVEYGDRLFAIEPADS
ncbi:MAG TPA: biotin/lipoyl-containing protein [Pseudonocardiaceae bacterium]